MKYTARDIADKTDIPETDIKNIYPTGSRVYGTEDFDSDYDYIVVAEGRFNNKEFRRGELNLHVYTPEHFQKKLSEQKFQFIEAFFSPKPLKEEIRFNYVPDIQKLRSEVSKNSDETAAMSRKLLDRGETAAAIKKLFHSIRIIDFAGQILKNSEIQDFSSSNHILQEIRNSFYYGDMELDDYHKIRKEKSLELSMSD